jgi:hypothetical protein
MCSCHNPTTIESSIPIQLADAQGKTMAADGRGENLKRTMLVTSYGHRAALISEQQIDETPIEAFQSDV